MRLDELFKSSSTLRWKKRGEKLSKEARERPLLTPLTKIEVKTDEKLR